MRFLIIPLFLLTYCAQGQESQNYDSLVKSVVRLEQQVKNIDLNMRAAHDQYRTGTYFIIAGAIATIAGPLIIEGSYTEDAIKSSPMIYVAGGIALTTGIVLQLDAHKFIGRGRRKKR